MGKTKVTTKSGGDKKGKVKTVKKRTSRRKLDSGILNIEASFNNVKVLFADKLGNTVFWSSAGSLGFRGARKGTPFAASKVGDLIGEKAKGIGVRSVGVVVKGVGSGREPAVRAFVAHGIEIEYIKDVTPVPHNGPKAKKPRRV